MGFVIGTTNLPRHLDDALWRRFDLDVLFKQPSQSVLREFVTSLARRKEFVLPSKVIQNAARAGSFASAERVVIGEIRRQALEPISRK